MPERLRLLISTMDVPEGRKTNITVQDIRWLSRNLGVRNSQHPDFSEAMNIINSILRNGNYYS